MGAFESMVRRQATANAAPTWGDWGRFVVSSGVTGLQAVPSMAAYGFSQIGDEDSVARDLEDSSRWLSDRFGDLNQTIASYNTPAAQRLLAAEVGSEEFWNRPLTWVGAQVAQNSVPVVAGVVAGVLSGGTAGLAIAGGMAGIQSGGLTYDQMVKDLDQVYADGKLHDNSLFKSYVARGLSDQEALRQFKKDAIGSKPAVMFALTAAMARFSAAGQFVSKLAPSAAAAATARASQPGITRRVLTAAVESGGEETFQNTAEEAALQAARVDAGVQTGADFSRLGQAAVAGALVGTAMGAPGGVFKGRGPEPVAGATGGPGPSSTTSATLPPPGGTAVVPATGPAAGTPVPDDVAAALARSTSTKAKGGRKPKAPTAAPVAAAAGTPPAPPPGGAPTPTGTAAPAGTAPAAAPVKVTDTDRAQQVLDDYEKVKQLAVQTGKTGVSFTQRQTGMSYPRAVRAMEMMVKEGQAVRLPNGNYRVVPPKEPEPTLESEGAPAATPEAAPATAPEAAAAPDIEEELRTYAQALKDGGITGAQAAQYMAERRAELEAATAPAADAGVQAEAQDITEFREISDEEMTAAEDASAAVGVEAEDWGLGEAEPEAEADLDTRRAELEVIDTIYRERQAEDPDDPELPELWETRQQLAQQIAAATDAEYEAELADVEAEGVELAGGAEEDTLESEAPIDVEAETAAYAASLPEVPAEQVERAATRAKAVQMFREERELAAAQQAKRPPPPREPARPPAPKPKRKKGEPLEATEMVKVVEKKSRKVKEPPKPKPKPRKLLTSKQADTEMARYREELGRRKPKLTKTRVNEMIARRREYLTQRDYKDPPGWFNGVPVPTIRKLTEAEEQAQSAKTAPKTRTRKRVAREPVVFESPEAIELQQEQWESTIGENIELMEHRQQRMREKTEAAVEGTVPEVRETQAGRVARRGRINALSADIFSRHAAVDKDNDGSKGAITRIITNPDAFARFKRRIFNAVEDINRTEQLAQKNDPGFHFPHRNSKLVSGAAGWTRIARKINEDLKNGKRPVKTLRTFLALEALLRIDPDVNHFLDQSRQDVSGAKEGDESAEAETLTEEDIEEALEAGEEDARNLGPAYEENRRKQLYRRPGDARPDQSMRGAAPRSHHGEPVFLHQRRPTGKERARIASQALKTRQARVAAADEAAKKEAAAAAERERIAKLSPEELIDEATDSLPTRRQRVAMRRKKLGMLEKLRELHRQTGEKEFKAALAAEIARVEKRKAEAAQRRYEQSPEGKRAARVRNAPKLRMNVVERARAKQRAAREAEVKQQAAGLGAAERQRAGVSEEPLGYSNEAMERMAALAAGTRPIEDATETNPVEVVVQGQTVNVQYPKGAVRPVAGKLAAHYGEMPGTVGVDGQPLDVYLGDKPILTVNGEKRPNDVIFVVRQHKLTPKKKQQGKFDENKVMLGFETLADAEKAYINSFDDGFGFARMGRIDALSVEDFNRWKADRKNTRSGDNITFESESQKRIEAIYKRQQAGIWGAANRMQRIREFQGKTYGAQKRIDAPTLALDEDNRAIRDLETLEGIAVDDAGISGLSEDVVELVDDIVLEQELAKTLDEAAKEEEAPAPAKPPQARKSTRPELSREEIKARRQAGISGGWLESPYIPGHFSQVRESTDVRTVLGRLNFAAAAKGVRGRGASLAFLKNRLDRLVGDMKIHVVSHADLRAMQGEGAIALHGNEVQDGVFIAAQEIPGTKQWDPYIVLSDDLFNNDQQRIADSVLHEVIHAATSRALDRDPQLQKQLRRLMDEVIRYHGIEDPSVHYGLENEHEFLAEAMTNAEFQQRLLGTPLSPQMQKAFGLKAGMTTAWHAFLKMVGKAVGLPTDQLTALHALVKVVHDLSAREADRAGITLESDFAPAAAPRAKISPRTAARRASAALVDYVSPGSQLRVPIALAFADTTQLARIARRAFGKASNPVRDLGHDMEAIVASTDRYMHDGEDVVNSTYAAQRASTPEQWETFGRYVIDQTIANVYGDRDLSAQTHLGKDPVGNPSLAAAQAKGKLAKLRPVWEKLPDNLKELLRKFDTFFKERQREMARLMIENRLRLLLDDPDPDPALVDRVLKRETTEADKKLIGKEALQKIYRGRELYMVKGPYFPLIRRGRFVVSALLKVKPPPADTGAKLKEGTTNIYEFRGKKAREQAMAYANSLEEKAWVSGRTVDEKTGETWYELPDGSEEPGSRRRYTLKDPDTERVFRVEVQNRYVEFFDTMRAAERVAAELQKDPDIDKVKAPTARRFNPGDRGLDFVSTEIKTLLEGLKKSRKYKDMNKTMQAELERSIVEFSLQMMGATRIHKRHMARKSVIGASTDIARAVLDYRRSTSSYMARMKHFSQVNDHLDALEESVHDEELPPEGAALRQALFNEMKKRVESNSAFGSNTRTPPALQRLLSTSFVARLASPMYTIMNMLQPYMVGGPVLAARHGVAKTYNAMNQAMKDLGTGAVMRKGLKETGRKFKAPSSPTETYIDDLKARLKDPNEKALMDLIQLRGTLESDKFERVRSTHGGPLTEAGAKLDTAISWTEGVARQLPTAAEVVNRSLILLAAYRLELARNGGNVEAATRYAEDTNNMTNFNYSEANTPPILNHPLAKIPFQFKRFGHGMYQLLGQQIGRAIRNEDGGRAEALKSLAYIVATHTLMAGTLGLPTEVPKALILGLYAVGVTGFNWQDVEHWERELAADLLGEDLGAVLTRGITRALPFGLGMDLSNRVGLADMMLARMPTSGDPETIKNWLFDMGLGAPGSMVFDWGEGVGDIMAGNVLDGAQKLAPIKVVADAIKTYQMVTEGKKTASGRPTLEPYTLSEAFVRLLGAAPRREAESSAIKSYFYSEQAAQDDIRNSIQQRWADGTTAQRMRMHGEIERYNRNKPRDAWLTDKALRAYTKRRATEVENMLSGISTSRANRYIVEDAQRVYND